MSKLKLLTIDQLAEALQVKRTWIYRRSMEGRIPVVRVGRYLSFQLEPVLKWLDEEYGQPPIEGWFLPEDPDDDEDEE